MKEPYPQSDINDSALYGVWKIFLENFDVTIDITTRGCYNDVVIEKVTTHEWRN